MAPRVIVVGAPLLAMVSAFGHVATAAGCGPALPASSTTTCSQDERVDDALDNVVVLLQVSLGDPQEGLPETDRKKGIYEGLPVGSPWDEPVRYLPSHQTLICACSKCGSTTLYNFVYEEIFGKTWPYDDDDWPYVKDVSARWEGELADAQASVMHSPPNFSFALVRDPKDRLISGWKSKAACFSEGCATDKNSYQATGLLALAYGSSGGEALSHGTLEEDGRQCLSFDEYLQALSLVHGHGDDEYLNVHFLPQQYGCFEHFPLHNWSQVIEIEQPDAFSALAQHLGDPSYKGMPEHHHSSDCKIPLTQEQANTLDVLTVEEYAFFASAGITFG